MKRKLLCSIILCFAFTKAYSAEVSSFVGDVTGERKGRPLRITTGVKLETGDVVRVGGRSTAQIRYTDRTVVTLSENTVITIGNVNIPASNDVTVVSGMVRAVFTGGNNRVYTPTAIAAIRGTEFTVTVNNGNTVVALDKGNLDVSNPYSQVQMNAGDNVRANVGSGVERPPRGRKQRGSTAADGDLNNLAANFDKYINDFDKSAQTQNANIRKSANDSQSATTPQDASRVSRNMDAMDASLRDALFLTEGTNRSLQLILDGIPNKSSREFVEFSRIREKGQTVAALKARNYADLQAVRQQHREAVEKIRSRFEEDRARILGR